MPCSPLDAGDWLFFDEQVVRVVGEDPPGAVVAVDPVTDGHVIALIHADRFARAALNAVNPSMTT